LIEYYQLRFQIEFNFRDAKQYWGLEDFMNISRNAVYNVANLAIFMVNISLALLQKNYFLVMCLRSKRSFVALGVHKLRGFFYVRLHCKSLIF
jgi:hypothetical protein